MNSKSFCGIYGKKFGYINNFSFSKHTTYGLGGASDSAYAPNSIDEATDLVTLLQNNGEPYFILGNGSNVLASDSGYSGTVICTKSIKGISYFNGELCCACGVTVSEMLDYCKKNALGGLEYLAGIPACVGGIVCMNAAAMGRAVSENVYSVKIFDGKTHELSKNDCLFNNKHSIMRDIKCLIASAKFKVYSDTAKNVSDKIRQALNLRKNQPSGKSCGCIFKNPTGISAGKLIDDAGLKGLAVGGAQVSFKHANFIINNSATANDVYSLICEVKRRVLSKFGIELCEEVVYIGEFNETYG